MNDLDQDIVSVACANQKLVGKFSSQRKANSCMAKPLTGSRSNTTDSIGPERTIRLSRSLSWSNFEEETASHTYSGDFEAETRSLPAPSVSDKFFEQFAGRSQVPPTLFEDEYYVSGTDHLSLGARGRIPSVESLSASINSLMEMLTPQIESTEPQDPLLELGIIRGVTTTVMLRNIPAKYNLDMLANLLNEVGFTGAYNFLHLPVDFRTRCSKGYAFLDMINPNIVPLLVARMGNYPIGQLKSLYVCGAAQQGAEANICAIKPANLRKMMKENYGPLVRNVKGELVKLKFPEIDICNPIL